MPSDRKWTIEEMKPGHEAKRPDGEVTIHWNDHKDAPRVLPPVLRADLGQDLVFRVKGNARAVVNVPDPVCESTDQVVIEPGGTGTIHLTSDRRALLPKGFMYAYTIEMTHLEADVKPELRAMEAVGCSPPGMVLDDPNNPDPGHR